MTTLYIYNSQGERLGDGPAPDSGRVEDYFFDGVRLYLDMSTDPEVVLFFRARDSEASRAEQYYAVYQTDTSTGLFERFERDLYAKVEDEQEMLIETDSDDTQLVSLLTAESEVPGTADQHGAISSLLAEEIPLRLQVRTEPAAFGLLRRYIGSPTEEFAIVDDTTTESVADCGLAIETGGDTELEPLGESADRFEEQLRRTTANAARPRTTEPAATTEPTDRTPLEAIGKEVLAISVGILITIVLLVALLNGFAVIGLEFPGTDWLIFV